MVNHTVYTTEKNNDIGIIMATQILVQHQSIKYHLLPYIIGKERKLIVPTNVQYSERWDSSELSLSNLDTCLTTII